MLCYVVDVTNYKIGKLDAVLWSVENQWINSDQRLQITFKWSLQLISSGLKCTKYK